MLVCHFKSHMVLDTCNEMTTLRIEGHQKFFLLLARQSGLWTLIHATGIVVSMQDQKSQIKNMEKAMALLRTRLYEREYNKYMEEMSSKRKTMVATGDRSEKVRTYNYPQSRVTDHRIGWSMHNLPAFMDGDIEDCIQALQLAENAEKLKASVG